MRLLAQPRLLAAQLLLAAEQAQRLLVDFFSLAGDPFFESPLLLQQLCVLLG